MRHYQIGHIVLLLLLLASTTVRGQLDSSAYSLNKKFSTAALLEDFELFQTALNEAHPGLHEYISKQELDQQFATIEHALTDSMTELEFYQHLLPLVVSIRCAHTWLQPSKAYYKNQRYFPLGIKIVNGGAYIFRNYSSDTTIVQATKIISINGLPMTEVVDRIYPLLYGDGTVETSKWYYLENSFHYYYAETFGTVDTFHIQGVLYESKDTVTWKLLGAEKQQFTATKQGTFSKSYQPFRAWFDDERSLAWLRVSSFSPYRYKKAKQHYPKALKSTFKRIRKKGIQHLVIDLRNNGGGLEDYSNLLFSYIAKQDFRAFTEVRSAGDLNYTFWKYTNLESSGFKLDDLKALLSKGIDSSYVLENNPGTLWQNPVKSPFEGKVLILMDGSTLSAAGLFANMAFTHGLADFAGQECGTNYYRINGNVLPVVTLPNTGLRLQVPLFQAVQATSGYPDNGHGLLPTYPVEYALEDWIYGRDPLKAFVLEWLEME